MVVGRTPGGSDVARTALIAALAALIVAPSLAHIHTPPASRLSNPPADMPHLPELFKTVKGNVDNVTAPVTALGGSTGIPEWLHATKYNNGFGQYEGVGFAFNYLFDVLAYVVKWRIDGNKVTFANKFIESEYHEQAKVKPPEFRTFGGYTPELSYPARLRTLTHLLSDNLNVKVMMVAGRLLAISDMNGAMELDPLTLDTLGLVQYNDSLTSSMNVITCAHPSKLPGDKYVYNYYVDVMGNFPHVMKLNEFQMFRVDEEKAARDGSLAREYVLKLPMRDGFVPYMHSFAQTPNYFVLFRFPLMWDLIGIMASTKILPHMKWSPKNGTHVLVIDKKSMSVVRELWTRPFFAYHHMNAFEQEDGSIACDISTVPCEGSKGGAECNHMNTFNLLTVKNDTFNIPNNTIERFIVPVQNKDAEITSRVLTKVSFDLVTMHPKKVGQPYRYVYGLADHGSGVWWSSLVKIDLETGEHLEWYKEDHYASEPNFIPRPGATDEDDGVLVSTVLGGDLGHSYLLVLDAKTMKPLARADAPQYLPFTSHGFANQDGA